MPNSVIPVLSNTDARRLFLHKHGLGTPPKGTGKGDDLAQLIDTLGFVQVDSINTVARAHHMILSSRRPAYKENNLKLLLERDRRLFEHWTHDASIIPTEFFPHWRLRFARDRERLIGRWRDWRRNGFEEKFAEVLNHISDHGPVTSATVGEDEKRSSGGWWDWHPSKTALEFLWRSGQISVRGRQGFQKVYDLTERVIPANHLNQKIDEQETIEWAAQSALDRLGFGTSGEIAAFWDLVTPAEAKDWCRKAVQNGRIVEIDIECVDASCGAASRFRRPWKHCRSCLTLRLAFGFCRHSTRPSGTENVPSASSVSTTGLKSLFLSQSANTVITSFPFWKATN